MSHTSKTNRFYAFFIIIELKRQIHRSCFNNTSSQKWLTIKLRYRNSPLLNKINILTLSKMPEHNSWGKQISRHPEVFLINNYAWTWTWKSSNPNIFKTKKGCHVFSLQSYFSDCKCLDSTQKSINRNVFRNFLNITSKPRFV